MSRRLTDHLARCRLRRAHSGSRSAPSARHPAGNIAIARATKNSAPSCQAWCAGRAWVANGSAACREIRRPRPCRELYSFVAQESRGRWRSTLGTRRCKTAPHRSAHPARSALARLPPQPSSRAQARRSRRRPPWWNGGRSVRSRMIGVRKRPRLYRIAMPRPRSTAAPIKICHLWPSASASPISGRSLQLVIG